LTEGDDDEGSGCRRDETMRMEAIMEVIEVDGDEVEVGDAR